MVSDREVFCIAVLIDLFMIDIFHDKQMAYTIVGILSTIGPFPIKFYSDIVP